MLLRHRTTSAVDKISEQCTGSQFDSCRKTSTVHFLSHDRTLIKCSRLPLSSPRGLAHPLSTRARFTLSFVPLDTSDDVSPCVDIVGSACSRLSLRGPRRVPRGATSTDGPLEHGSGAGGTSTLPGEPARLSLFVTTYFEFSQTTKSAYL